MRLGGSCCTVCNTPPYISLFIPLHNNRLHYVALLSLSVSLGHTYGEWDNVAWHAGHYIVVTYRVLCIRTDHKMQYHSILFESTLLTTWKPFEYTVPQEKPRMP
jgi:hypothetical protein